MKNKTLAQILRPIATVQFAEQRNHIHSQFKRMLANGMSREQALQHAQFSVDSLTGNYAQSKDNAALPLMGECDCVSPIKKTIQCVFRRLWERVGWFQAA